MTDMQKSAGPILKTDTRGRVQTPTERRERLLDEFARSGLSGAKFAALVGIKYSTFASWAQRRRRQRGSAPVPAKSVDSGRWLEAVMDQAHNPGGENQLALVLQLPGGARVEVGDEKQAVLAGR